MQWNKMRSTQKRRYKLHRQFVVRNEEKDIVVHETYTKIREEDSPYLCHITCECGLVFSLSKKYHTVDNDGIVFPSVGHSQCKFHEWIVLEEWMVKTEILSYIEYCPYCKLNPCPANCEVEIAEYTPNQKGKKK